MRYTNQLGLPQPIFDAVVNDPYDKGDSKYSITGLLKPPRIAALERLHADELVEDVADRIYSLLGQSVHGILERAETTAMAEERLYATIDGIRISGKIDRFVYHDGILQDYKVTSIYKTKDGCPEEWEAQLNSYAWLFGQNGYEVRRSEVVAIYRDWHRTTAKKGHDGYPLLQAERISIRMWPDGARLAFLKKRIEMHEQAATATRHDALPVCTNADMWADAHQWAVLKPGSKRAVRVYDTEGEARAHLGAFPLEGYIIEFRPGKPKRCEDWCSVRDFCDQYKAYREKQ